MTKLFFVSGAPVPKGRPRVTMAGGFARAYTPATTVKWEKQVLAQAYDHRPAEVPDGPIKVMVKFFMPLPKSARKGVMLHTKRPDLDNLVKAVIDALQGVFFKDDGQISEISASKCYAGQGGPGVLIGIFCLNDDGAVCSKK